MVIGSANVMSTDQVAPAERLGYWSSWIDRLFNGLKSDQYGDTQFEGRVATLHAGDIVLTRLEANRHRVGDMVVALNFGVLEIDWNARPVTLRFAVLDDKEQVRLEHVIPLSRLQP